jgi:hypothetical protein
VLEAVYRISLVRLEVCQDPEKQIGQLADVLLVHPSEHRKIRIGPLVHPPEVHFADVLRHYNSLLSRISASVVLPDNLIYRPMPQPSPRL